MKKNVIKDLISANLGQMPGGQKSITSNRSQYIRHIRGQFIFSFLPPHLCGAAGADTGFFQGGGVIRDMRKNLVFGEKMSAPIKNRNWKQG